MRLHRQLCSIKPDFADVGLGRTAAWSGKWSSEMDNDRELGDRLLSAHLFFSIYRVVVRLFLEP